MLLIRIKSEDPMEVVLKSPLGPRFDSRSFPEIGFVTEVRNPIIV